jgi:universal stress protein E
MKHALCLMPENPKLAKRAMQRAAEFCDWVGADLTVMDWVDPPPLFAEEMIPYEVHEALLAQRQLRLDRWISQAKLKREVSRKVFEGAPVPTILAEVTKSQYDLVIKLAEPVGWVSRVFGSLDMRLLRKLPCPVLALKSVNALRLDRILVAVDPTGEDALHRSLDVKLLRTALALAEITGAAVHVLHAWTVHPQYLAGDMSNFVTENKVDQWVIAHRRVHKRALDALLQQIFERKPKRLQVHLEEGDPASAVVKAARTLRADLLVMGTVARGGVAGLIMGNTAEKILGQVRCSVLAIKPDDFKL